MSWAEWMSSAKIVGAASSRSTGRRHWMLNIIILLYVVMMIIIMPSFSYPIHRIHYWNHEKDI